MSNPHYQSDFRGRSTHAYTMDVSVIFSTSTALLLIEVDGAALLAGFVNLCKRTAISRLASLIGTSTVLQTSVYLHPLCHFLCQTGGIPFMVTQRR